MQPYYFDTRERHLYCGRRIVLDQLVRETLAEWAMMGWPSSKLLGAKAHVQRSFRAAMIARWAKHVRYGNA